MNWENIFKVIETSVAVFLAIVTFLHVRLEYRKLNLDKSRPYYPTFSAILLTLLLMGVLLLSIVNYIHPQALPTFWDNAVIIRQGVASTITVSVLAILLGTAIGIILALVLAIPKRNVFLSVIDCAIWSFIYILLGIPALVFLFICYFATNALPFWPTVFALGINLAPFVTKIVHSSIRNISQDQIDAVISFGYNRWERFRFFEVPFVVKNAGQALLVQYYTTIKLSSLASFVGLFETFHATRDVAARTQDPVSVYIITAICYVAIVTWIALLADYLAQRWQPTPD